MLGGDWTDGTMTDFKWRHFQGDVILWAVRWYCRYPISYRDLEEMLAERGISRPEEHTSELQSLMRISYAVFCLKKKTPQTEHHLSFKLLKQNTYYTMRHYNYIQITHKSP